jgi:DNA-binding GntR family transcriptional regulator
MQMNERNSIQSSVPSLAADKSRSNFADQVFEVLRQHIVTGELRPNQRLIESEIAKELGVSRTPVREALKRLEVTGYVSTLPGSGLIVTEHSTRQIQSLFEIREALETMAIKLACEHITQEHISKAEEYHNRGVEAIRNRDLDLYIDLHSHFHEQLYAACGNEQLLSLVRMFRYQYFDRRLARVYAPREWDTQIKHHSQILEAVRQRSARRAEKTLQRHLRTSLKVALQRL